MVNAMTLCPRLAVRAILLHENRLLLVNAWAKGSDLLCAPGGGVERGRSLPENLKREVFEETGLTVSVGAPCLVNEFHDPEGTLHQVDLYFRATLVSGSLDPNWKDPEGIVKHRRWVSRTEMADLNIKPDSLADVAWGGQSGETGQGPITYDPLEPIQR